MSLRLLEVSRPCLIRIPTRRIGDMIRTNGAILFVIGVESHFLWNHFTLLRVAFFLGDAGLRVDFLVAAFLGVALGLPFDL